METQLSFKRMNEDDSPNHESSRCCVVENGKMTTHLRDVDVVSSCLVCDANGVSLCPTTPIPRRKNVEPVLVITTPLSPGIDGLNSVECGNVSNVCEDSPRTPKEGVFNPFAPGPEEMCLAPCKKIVKECRRFVARRLNFDDVEDPPTPVSDDDKEVEMQLEKMLYETVYGILLEAIILKQTEDFLAENRDLELKGCRTPTSPLPLSGISETCPAAPTKGTTRKLLNIDPGLCRKLEF